jgi:PAS domain S-box-containing protein
MKVITTDMSMVTKIWKVYKRYVDLSIQGQSNSEVKDIDYWRDRLFKNFILYALPTSFFALLPALYFGLKEGATYIVIFDVIIIFLIAFISLDRKIKLKFRKALVALIFYVFAVVLILHLGSFGPGILYLLSTTIFSTLFFSGKLGYLSIVIHVLTSVFLGLVIHFKLFNSPLIQEYQLGSWTAYCSNLVFLSLIIVVIISKMVNGLESTIIHVLNLHQTLTNEGIVKMKMNAKITESEGHHKSLFVQNPSPMWVIDSKDLKFLQVNEAAIQEYGYTENEFLSMTVRDLHPTEDWKCIHEKVSVYLKSNSKQNYVTSHIKKNNEIFDVEIRINSIMLQGKGCILAIVRDITEQINYIKAIEKQNDKLQDIAYLQSHMARAPLANILGLVNVIKMDMDQPQEAIVIEKLDAAAKQFDQIIKSITMKI